MKRVALYARYSSELQDERSIEGQFAMLRAEAERRGWTVVREFRDEAMSGYSLIGRPGIDAMLRAAGDGHIDVVMAEALDRLSRDLADTETLRKRLAFHGIAIWTLSEGAVEILHTGLKGMMNSMFLMELGRKTKRGQLNNLADGRSAGGRTYGYRAVKGEPGRLEIDEGEAAIVRRIHTEYAGGDSPIAIVQRLNAEGVPGPRGRGWSESTVNGEAKLGHGILHNELYIGMRVWNRQSKRKDPRTGRALMFNNPESEWKRMPAPELRIVDDGLWRAVRARHRGVTGKRGGAKRPKRLFSGLLACGCCGGGMSIVGAGASYGCSNRYQKRACENARTITERQVTARTVEGLKRALLDPEAIRLAAARFHARMVQDQREASGRRASIAKELADVDARISRLVDAIAEGGERGALLSKLRQLEEDRERLSESLQAFEHTAPVRLHPNAGKLYADTVARLGELLSAPENPALREAIRALVGRIVLTPRAHGPGYEMEVRGDIAPLLIRLEAAQTQPQNALSPAVSSGAKVFMGAGPRFGHSLMPYSVPA